MKVKHSVSVIRKRKEELKALMHQSLAKDTSFLGVKVSEHEKNVAALKKKGDNDNDCVCIHL
eukprot:m.108677 g.108677  ORF g.108677 m.108677 type:complete len:62 (-) comp9192_c0_seq19:176-361(-)